MASYWNDILTAIKAQVASIDGIPPVKRRKVPAFWRDEKRVVCICAVSDEYDRSSGTFAGPDGRRVVKVIYTVSIAIMDQSNSEWETDEFDPDAKLLEWRELIRQKLDQPRLEDLQTPALPGAPTVFNVDVNLGDVYDSGALSKAYNDSRLTVVCDSYEPANGPHPSITV